MPHVTRMQVGTLQYLAPEVLQKQPTTRATDVYAYAIAVNEIATGVFPFSDASKDNPRAQTILEYGYDRCCLHLSCTGAEHLHAVQPRWQDRGSLR